VAFLEAEQDGATSSHARTDAKGRATLKFRLPATIADGAALVIRATMEFFTVSFVFGSRRSAAVKSGALREMTAGIQIVVNGETREVPTGLGVTGLLSHLGLPARTAWPWPSSAILKFFPDLSGFPQRCCRATG